MCFYDYVVKKSDDFIIKNYRVLIQVTAGVDYRLSILQNFLIIGILLSTNVFA